MLFLLACAAGSVDLEGKAPIDSGTDVADTDTDTDTDTDADTDTDTDTDTCDDEPPVGADDPCPHACTGGCDHGVCTISCGEEECEESTITCPDDYACVVDCDGDDSCDVAIVVCPDVYACTLQCEGDDACGDLRLECGEGTCAIECGRGDTSCAGTEVFCGEGACIAECDGDSSPSRMHGCDDACDCEEC